MYTPDISTRAEPEQVLKLSKVEKIHFVGKSKRNPMMDERTPEGDKRGSTVL